MIKSSSSLCRHFPECSGCDSLDVEYQQQLEQKSDKIEKSFRFFHKLKIHPMIASPVHQHYRHKLQLPFGHRGYQKKIQPAYQRKTELVLGLHSRDLTHIIDQQECLIQDVDLTTVAFAVRSWAQKNQLLPYDERSHGGLLRHLVLRKAQASSEILLGLVTQEENFPGSKPLFQQLQLDIAEQLKKTRSKSQLVGMIQNINNRKTSMALGFQEKLIWGRPYIQEKIGNLNFRIGLGNFFQVNPYQILSLYQEVLKNIDKGSFVIDAYCGIGTIGQFISEKAAKVVGLEENKSSIQKAVDSARANKIENVRFRAGNTHKHLQEYLDFGADAVIVDPPRMGLDEKTLGILARADIKKLIYVSCDPDTLLRDAKILKHDFNFVSLTPVDLFPHTHHIESVSVFEKFRPTRPARSFKNNDVSELPPPHRPNSKPDGRRKRRVGSKKY